MCRAGGFDDQEALEAALNSKEMTEGFEDAKRFANLEKTYGLTVDEQVGRA